MNINLSKKVVSAKSPGMHFGLSQAVVTFVLERQTAAPIRTNQKLDNRSTLEQFEIECYALFHRYACGSAKSKGLIENYSFPTGY